MKEHIDMVKEFHEKFRVSVLSTPSLISKDSAERRFKFMHEEVLEYLEGVKNNDLINIAKELADILYVVYGTILEHGLQDKISLVFEEVHKSNMTKDYHEYKMVKGKDYVKADVKKFF